MPLEGVAGQGHQASLRPKQWAAGWLSPPLGQGAKYLRKLLSFPDVFPCSFSFYLFSFFKEATFEGCQSALLLSSPPLCPPGSPLLSAETLAGRRGGLRALWWPATRTSALASIHAGSLAAGRRPWHTSPCFGQVWEGPVCHRGHVSTSLRRPTVCLQKSALRIQRGRSRGHRCPLLRPAQPGQCVRQAALLARSPLVPPSLGWRTCSYTCAPSAAKGSRPPGEGWRLLWGCRHSCRRPADWGLCANATSQEVCERRTHQHGGARTARQQHPSCPDPQARLQPRPLLSVSAMGCGSSPWRASSHGPLGKRENFSLT